MSYYFEKAVKTIQVVLNDQDATDEQIMSVINAAAKTHTGILWFCAVCRYVAHLHSCDLQLNDEATLLPERLDIVPHITFSCLYLSCLFLKTDLDGWTNNDYEKSINYLAVLSNNLEERMEIINF